MKYINLFFMTVLSFISMYILMYMMVDSYGNVYSNLNQLYMAGIMTIPMIMIELFLMRSMYNNKMFNFLISGSSLVTFILLIVFLRKQIEITDKEFLKSMIPHHGAAILMCKKNKLIQDPEIKKLCEDIVSAQQSEIDFMKEKLKSIKSYVRV